MNETSIQTKPDPELYIGQKYEDKLHYSRKLAEIDYMLFVIEKSEVITQADVYSKYHLSDLKTKLEKRLIVFAWSENHREYEYTHQQEGKMYGSKYR